jgi:proteic killer suppression protein
LANSYNEEIFSHITLDLYTKMVYIKIMEDIYNVKLSAKANKDLKKVPLPIAIKLQSWIEAVGQRGLNEVKKIPGYHDEPVKGKIRKGQRSIRLNIAYRAFYIMKSGVISFVEVVEVNKHEY